MVNRHARDVAARALQEFTDGSLSNRDYERRFPKSKADPALWGIYSQLWFCYSDTSEHTMTGKHALTDEGRAFIKRCLLFLKSDLEFQWPSPRLRLWYPVLRLIGFGRVLNRQIEKQMSKGDADVWPFLKKTDYEEALSKHAHPKEARVAFPISCQQNTPDSG